MNPQFWQHRFAGMPRGSCLARAGRVMVTGGSRCNDELGPRAAKLCYYSTIVSNIRVGTSGWHYPTGRGRWDGVFYPARRGRGKTFDELAYYAAHFDTVEVNSTFYGQPRTEVTRAWAERTPAGFQFSVKLY